MPCDLAALLGYPGDGQAMILALKAVGYLDEQCQIVGWTELYALPASRQRAAKTGAKGRWNNKSSFEGSDRRKVTARPRGEEKEKREEKEAHALRDGMRDASEHSRSPVFGLSVEEMAHAATGMKMTPAGIAEALRVFNEIKANFPNDPRSPEVFRGWLRTSRHGKELACRFPQTSRSGASEPKWKSEPKFDWRAWLRAERPPDNYPRTLWENGAWAEISETWKEEIWKHVDA